MHSENHKSTKRFKLLLAILIVCFFYSCKEESKSSPAPVENKASVQLIVLGQVQDGGSPHIACKKKCCANLFEHPDATRMVTSLGLIDCEGKKTYLFEASPDITRQIHFLNQAAQLPLWKMPDAVFLTHAHIGHYSGLMYFGREALGAKGIKVYALPRMNDFLLKNGPWSQLCAVQNIKIDSLNFEQAVFLSANLKVTALQVPHRDEFSETAGFLIESSNKKALFIPDIDKWHKWNRDLVTEIKKVDFALIDATFFDAAEIGHRNMSEIPHPFVTETMELLKDLTTAEKNKIWFIHMNHTNALLNEHSEEYKKVLQQGYHVAKLGSILPL